MFYWLLWLLVCIDADDDDDNHIRYHRGDGAGSEEFEMSAQRQHQTKQTNKQEHIAEKCLDYGLSSVRFNLRLTTERTTCTNQ